MPRASRVVQYSPFLGKRRKARWKRGGQRSADVFRRSRLSIREWNQYHLKPESRRFVGEGPLTNFRIGKRSFIDADNTARSQILS